MHATCFLKGELILGRADTLIWHQANRWQGNLKRLKGYKKGNRTTLKILCARVFLFCFLMSPSSYESEEECVTITISRLFFKKKRAKIVPKIRFQFYLLLKLLVFLSHFKCFFCCFFFCILLLLFN